MKKQLTLAALLGASMFLGAADTYESLSKEGQKLLSARKVEAAAKFDSAMKIAKTPYQRFWSSYYRTRTYLDCKKYPETIQSARESLKLAAAPKNGISDQQAIVYWQMGLAYRYMGKNQESLENYVKSAQLAPRNSWIFTNSSTSAGDRASALKKYDDAQKYFRQVYVEPKVEINARSSARYQQALLLTGINKPQEALKLLEKAENFFPKLNDYSKAQIWDARGRSYLKLKKTDDALKAYTEMYKYTDKYDSYRAFSSLQLAFLYSAKKDLASAAKYAQLCLDCKKASWGRDVRSCNNIIAQYQKSLKK